MNKNKALNIGLIITSVMVIGVSGTLTPITITLVIIKPIFNALFLFIFNFPLYVPIIF